MNKIAKRIEIVRSTTKGLSSMSQKACDAIYVVLAKHYDHVGVSVVNNVSDLEALVALRPDLVFLGMKFVPDNAELGFHDPAKVWVTSYLDKHDIAYTGSSQMAHVLELNKPLAKQRVQEAGLNTAPFFVAHQDSSQSISDMPLEFPVFVKPTNRGGGLGIDSDSVAHNFGQMESKARSISARLGSDSLIEEYLPGREFSVAILADEDAGGFLVMPIELIAPPDRHGRRILSGRIKHADTERSILVTDQSVKHRVMELAINVFHALGARDYGRIDIRLDSAGTPHFLEANLVPSLKNSDGNYFPKACVLNEGLDYETIILSIVNLAFARTPQLIVDQLEPDMFPALMPEPLALT